MTWAVLPESGGLLAFTASAGLPAVTAPPTTLKTVVAPAVALTAKRAAVLSAAELPSPGGGICACLSSAAAISPPSAVVETGAIAVALPAATAAAAVESSRAPPLISVLSGTALLPLETSVPFAAETGKEAKAAATVVRFSSAPLTINGGLASIFDRGGRCFEFKSIDDTTVSIV